MKKIYSFLLFMCLIIQNSSFAQYERAEQAIKMAPYIFEGKVVALDFIQDKQANYFVSYKVEVLKTLKGGKHLKEKDTVELVSEMPTGWHIFENGEFGSEPLYLPLAHQKGLHLGVPMIGVFLVSTNESQVSDNNFSNSFTSICVGSDCFYRISALNNYDITLRKRYVTHTIEGFGVKFSSLEGFNSFLNRMNLFGLSGTVKKKDVQEVKKDSVNAIKYSSRLAKSLENDQFLNNRKTNSNHINPKTVQNIKFEILNEQVTGTTTKYFEFDIMVSGSSSDTYLDNSAFVVEFNTFAFGVNLAANNLIEITRGTDFNTSTYEDPMIAVTDDAPNAIRFRIGTDFNGSTWNRVNLNTSQNQLAHLKIPIIDCYGMTDIQFIDIVNVSFVALYTNSSSESPITAPYLAYDYVEYVQPNPFALCPPPAISSFSPTTISAGTESTLTITGHGFGSQRGESQIRFLEANNGGSSIIPYLNGNDFTYWSDTEIKLVLPNFVDSLGVLSRPGSGIFEIEIENGPIISSILPININYSVMNFGTGMVGTSNYQKIPYRHVDKTTLQNGRAREFSLDTSITNNPQMAAIVKKSLETWTCATGINWVIADTVTQQGLLYDGKSVIFLTDNLFQGDTILGVTKSNAIYLCADELTNKNFVYADETDIAFARYKNIANQTPVNWFYDTTLTLDLENNDVDFYQTVIHELGHAHYLGHVNNTSDILGYLILPGPINASNRLQLYTSFGSMDGGIHVTSENNLLEVTSCGGTINNTTPQYAQFCGDLGLFGIKKPTQEGSINLYPNPFNETLNLSFELDKVRDASFIVYDIFGRIVFNKDLGSKSNGLHTETIDLKSNSSGIYMIKVRLDEEIFNYKIVKK